MEKENTVDSTSSNHTVQSMRNNLVIIGSAGLMIVVGVGIWSIREYWSTIGFLIAGITIFVFLTVAAFPLVALIRFLSHGRYYEMEQFGGYYKPILGSMQALPPLNAANTKLIASPKGKLQTKVEPDIPTLLELLDSQEIRAGMTDMILGYLEDGEIVRGPWPRTFAVAGKGRSGKTRRVVFMIAQALLGGAHITVCDPHHTKRDSLTKELGALSPWLHFAGTDEEIEAATDDFLSEMERRVHGESQEAIDEGIFKPRLTIYDEWSRLMSKLTEEQQEKLKEAVTGASQEYAAYDGFVCIIGQNWTNDVCGGTAIRRALHAVFVHRIDTDYAKYLIKPAKWHKQTEGLSTGHCFYQDLDGIIRKLIMPNVPDRACTRVAEIMMQVSPPEKQQELAPVEQVQRIARGDRTTGPLPAYPMIEAPTSHYEQKYQNMDSQAQNTVILMPGSTPGSNQAVNPGSDSGSDERVTDETFVKVLREIGKKLKAGDTPNDIRKSLGITGGRAMQEVNAALNFLQEHTDMEVNE